MTDWVPSDAVSVQESWAPSDNGYYVALGLCRNCLALRGLRVSGPSPPSAAHPYPPSAPGQRPALP